MRVLVSLLTVATILLSVHALAVGDDPQPARSTLKTEQRLKVLELEVELLRSREAALTSYMMANRERAKGLDFLAKEVRRLGFETARIQISSRRALLAGLEEMALAMVSGLPETSTEEEVLLKQLDALLR